MEIWTLYVTAPVPAVQLRETGIATFTAPFDGNEIEGTPGAAGIVVKLRGPAQLLVPPEFVALTSQ
jgi:hypothetical protein